MPGFALHPAAYTDLDEIWEYIAADNLTLPTAFSKRFTRRSARL
jgi:plasmid stabilization system protein ParE